MTPKFLSRMKAQCWRLAHPVLSVGQGVLSSTSRPICDHLAVYLPSVLPLVCLSSLSFGHQEKFEGEE